MLYPGACNPSGHRTRPSLPPHLYRRPSVRQPLPPVRAVLLLPPHHPPPRSRPKIRLARVSTYHLPIPEDRDSIRVAIAQVMHDIANNYIDLRRAGLILYSLQIALCALPKEPRMSQSAQSIDLHAAARPSKRRKPKAPGQPPTAPLETSVIEAVLDQTHGLIAPETFLGIEDPEEEEVEADPGDEVLEDGRLLRNTLGYKLLKDVELYEARTQGWHRGRVDALEEAAKTASTQTHLGAVSAELRKSITTAASQAAVEEAAFSAHTAAGRSKSSIYTGNV